ncbi:MAG: hypothetical protein DRZ90_11635 [Spirochaetes bacterium]|nr:MAG: hypothetical protein DRZ90_11635 [Spirochaetota bacterium]
MKTYKCVTECYADDFHRYRKGDLRYVQDSYHHSTLDEKFELVNADKPIKKDRSGVSDLLEGVSAFAKKNNISSAQQKKIFIAASAIDPADKLKALIDFVEEH